MSDPDLAETFQREVTCPVCKEYFKEPVTLSCAHSFCRACLPRPGKDEERSFRCPECPRVTEQTLFQANWRLARLAHIARDLQPRPRPRVQEANVCAKHREKLDHFCRDDHAAICVVCKLSRDHRAHTIWDVAKAARVFKEELQEAKQKLSQDLEEVQTLLAQEKTKTAHWKDKVAAQRRVIEAQFEATRRLLAEEERAQLRKLEEEEEKGLQNLQKNRAELARNVAGLERTIAHLDRETQKPPLELLRESRDTISRCEEALRPPEVVSVDLERECHVPGLQEMLSKFAVDMTLDRDSAHGDLEVSRDGRSVKNGWNDPSDEARPPDPSAGVLGSASFSAGRHYWEVDVAAKTAWELGLCLESAPREGLTAPGPQDGFWILKLDRESGYFACTSPRTHLPLGAVVDRLAVYLDVEAGVVAFYDAERGTLIYTFSASFSGPLRPFFCPQLPYGGENGVPLTLCPATPLDSEDPSLPDILVVEA